MRGGMKAKDPLTRRTGQDVFRGAIHAYPRRRRRVIRRERSQGTTSPLSDPQHFATTCMTKQRIKCINLEGIHGHNRIIMDTNAE